MPLCQCLHYLIVLEIPKYDTVLCTVWLCECINNCVGAITPLKNKDFRVSKYQILLYYFIIHIWYDKAILRIKKETECCDVCVYVHTRMHVCLIHQILYFVGISWLGHGILCVGVFAPKHVSCSCLFSPFWDVNHGSKKSTI